MQKALGFLFFIFSFSSFPISLTKVQVDTVSRRRLKQTDPLPYDYKLEVDPNLVFPNPRLKRAYCAFQEWKKVIYSDPQNITGDWVGPDVCSYTGVFCTHALDDPKIETVFSVDLNFGDLAGHLVPQIGLLTDLGILHLHSNRFYGIFPKSISNLTLLFELDASDNHFVGPFPTGVLEIPSLKFLDIRFNEFEGALPPELFDKQELDAIIVNNNRFQFHLPDNMGNSPVSMLVLSHNKFSGCIPKSFGHMPYLRQCLLSNNLLGGCLPEEVGMLQTITLFDVSNNNIAGPLPKSLKKLKMVEEINISSNLFTGRVTEGVCTLPALSNFSMTNNYFTDIDKVCESLCEETNPILELTDNCFPDKPDQRSEKLCLGMLSRPRDCKSVGCGQRYGPAIVVPRHRKIITRITKPPSPVKPPVREKTPVKSMSVPKPRKVTPKPATAQQLPKTSVPATPPPLLPALPPPAAVVSVPPNMGSRHL